VLEPETFDRIPRDTAWSIERSYFPSLVERGETFVAYTHRGYWIDIGTPEKYTQVHRDVMDGRYQAPPFAGSDAGRVWTAPAVRVEDGAAVEGPAFLDEGVVVKAGARIGPYTVLGRHCHVEEEAVVRGTIVWANSRIGQGAAIEDAILGRHCHVGRGAVVGAGTVLGDKSALTDCSRT
jgi:NDP-sugar pyrophosphorylase family protein